MTNSPQESEAAASRRSRLVGIKLRALVRDHLDADEVAEPQPFGPGAALIDDGVAWVYLDDSPASRLGAALAWAIRAGATELNVIAEAGTGVLARRVGEFSFPVTVWYADGRVLLPAVAEPFLEIPPVIEQHESFRALIVESGATPLVEAGVLVGEVRGLEVCRVVTDEATATVRLEVGVGAHDREAFQMLHGDTPTLESLTRIVEAVEGHRRPDGPPHPLQLLAAERLLRWGIEQQPRLVAAVEIRPAEPPVRRVNLKDPVPCVAHGVDADGGRVVVVCSTGVDLDLVPYAADARLAAGGAAAGVVDRLVMVTPSRDRLPLTDKLAGLLRQSAEFVSLD